MYPEDFELTLEQQRKQHKDDLFWESLVYGAVGVIIGVVGTLLFQGKLFT